MTPSAPRKGPITQASEEAMSAAQWLSDQKCPHLKIGAIHGRGLSTVMANRCDQCVALLLDRVSREALERAAKVADAEEEAFMESSRRMDAAGRTDQGTSEINAALACKAVAAAIRALIVDPTDGGQGGSEG